MIRVWDPLVRIFHWSLVVAIAVTWVTSEDSIQWHEWIGYAALGLIGFRLIWGIIGPRYARFTQFIRSPGEVIGYIKDLLGRREKRYIGHNPLGGLMVVALLLMTAATGFSGWLMAEPDRLAMLPDMPAIAAPAFAGSDEQNEDREEDGEREGGESSLKDIHELLANMLLLLIFAHVGGVIYAGYRHKDKLAMAMITGNKAASGPEDLA